MANLKLSSLAFEKKLDEVRAKIEAELDTVEDKEVNYGRYMNFTDGAKKASLTVYNGKKGWSEVYAGDDALKQRLYDLVHDVNDKTPKGRVTMIAAKSGSISSVQQAAPDMARDGVYQADTHSPSAMWAGSDESGKGDFFGPLVVASAVVDGNTAAKLAAAGVKDCKLLTDKKILELEDVIKKNVIDFAVLNLKPTFYNKRYAQIVAEGGKLNQLLGSGHVNALSKVLERHPNCVRALIDQFTPSDVNVRVLSNKFPGCHIAQMPKAESDLAVAAASVLARAEFLHTMQDLAQRAGVDELPKGGGDHATAFARKLAVKLGSKEALRDYVKMHFANYKKI